MWEVSRCEYLTCMSRKRACPRRAVTLNRRKHSCAREVPDISVPSVRVDLSKKRKIPRAPDQTAPFIPPHINRRGGAACMDQLMWVRELECVRRKRERAWQMPSVYASFTSIHLLIKHRLLKLFYYKKMVGILMKC